MYIWVMMRRSIINIKPYFLLPSFDKIIISSHEFVISFASLPIHYLIFVSAKATLLLQEGDCILPVTTIDAAIEK